MKTSQCQAKVPSGRRVRGPRHGACLDWKACAPGAWPIASVKRLGRVRFKASGEDHFRKYDKKWTHWDLNPGPSACEADVIPLHHEPSDMAPRLLASTAFHGACARAKSGAWAMRLMKVAPRRASMFFGSAALHRPRVGHDAVTLGRNASAIQHLGT